MFRTRPLPRSRAQEAQAPRPVLACVSVVWAQLVVDAMLFVVASAAVRPSIEMFLFTTAPGLLVGLPLALAAARRRRVSFIGAVAGGALAGVLSAVAGVAWDDLSQLWEMPRDVGAGMVVFGAAGIIGGLVFWRTWRTGLRFLPR